MKISFDLGVRRLLPEWKRMVSSRGLREDVLAGANVAGVALPLSLAVGLASSVHPSVGLISAVVGSVVCAIWGGTTLSISGPAAAMAVLTGSIVEENGLAVLLAVGFLCGVFQLLAGVLGLGQWFRHAPTPVITGFTAGVGAILLIGQLPRALGLPPPPENHVLDVIAHLGELLHDAKAVPLILALLTLGITFGLPRLLPRLPAPLIAVIVPSLVALVWKWDVPYLEGEWGIPVPKLPLFGGGDFFSVFEGALVVAAVASLQTLLAARTADRLSRGPRHDPDQELIGQGLGNVAVSIFGGIPVTSVIARTSLNIQAGARTRRASLVNAFLVFLAFMFFRDWIAHIPLAVVAGILLSIAVRMLSPREFRHLLAVSKIDALVYLATFLAVVFLDLVLGVQASVLVALGITIWRAWRARNSGGYSEWIPRSRLEGDASEARLSRGKLFEGVERYRSNLQSRYRRLFETLAEGQSPHTLFITCSDSRISPNLITATEPGELFVVRNVGNIVPAFGSTTPAEGAAIEYAIGVLGVKEIVVCGHTRCGAMAEIVSGKIYMPENAKRFPSVAEWLKEGGDLRTSLPAGATPDQASEINLRIQLERLGSYPIVKEAVAQGRVKLHAWIFDIQSGEVREWSQADQAFIPVGARFDKEVSKRMRAGLQFQRP